MDINEIYTYENRILNRRFWLEMFILIILVSISILYINKSKVYGNAKEYHDTAIIKATVTPVEYRDGILKLKGKCENNIDGFAYCNTN